MNKCALIFSNKLWHIMCKQHENNQTKQLTTQKVTLNVHWGLFGVMAYRGFTKHLLFGLYHALVDHVAMTTLFYTRDFNIMNMLTSDRPNVMRGGLKRLVYKPHFLLPSGGIMNHWSHMDVTIVPSFNMHVNFQPTDNSGIMPCFLFLCCDILTYWSRCHDNII